VGQGGSLSRFVLSLREDKNLTILLESLMATYKLKRNTQKIKYIQTKTAKEHKKLTNEKKNTTRFNLLLNQC
jgi:hypothetical protein